MELLLNILMINYGIVKKVKPIAWFKVTFNIVFHHCASVITK